MEQLKHMSNMFVLVYDNEQGAGQVRDKMVELIKNGLIELDDAAVVVRKADGKVKVNQAVNLVGQGALGGAFWGMLIGLLFMAPWLGLIVGAASGALGGASADYGVSDEFIKETGKSINPGNSALFLLVRRATPDKVIEAIKPFGGKLVHSTLDADQEAKLLAMFNGE
jgi:uncharacterized membrane protein